MAVSSPGGSRALRPAASLHAGDALPDSTPPWRRVNARKRSGFDGWSCAGRRRVQLSRLLGGMGEDAPIWRVPTMPASSMTSTSCGEQFAARPHWYSRLAMVREAIPEPCSSPGGNAGQRGTANGIARASHASRNAQHRALAGSGIAGQRTSRPIGDMLECCALLAGRTSRCAPARQFLPATD